MPPEVTVVIPTFNEADNLSSIATAVARLGYRIIVVDDNSPDGTGAIGDELAAKSDGISIVHRPVKVGLGPAYADGFASAIASGAEIVCEMDADFSHDPSELPSLVEAVVGGADLAIGSRYVPGGAVPGWPIHRRLLSRWGNRYARLMLRTDLADMTSGFRAFRATFLEQLSPGDCEASGYGFQVEMAHRAHERGGTVVELPITFRDRILGESKMNWRIALEAIRLVTWWGVRLRLAR